MSDPTFDSSALAPAKADVLGTLKLPPLDALYWATLLGSCAMGETAADMISHDLGLGYAGATALLAALFLAAMFWEFGSRQFHPSRYWLAIVVTSTVGTTLADLTTRTLGLGYGGGSLLLIVLFAIVFATWRRRAGRGIEDTRSSEFHYWAAILVASTMGTTIGDFVSNGTALGFGGGAVLLASILGAVFLIRRFTSVSREFCYWLAVVLTSTFGAAAGDYITKDEGLNQGTYVGTVLLAALLVAILAVSYVVEKRRPLETI